MGFISRVLFNLIGCAIVAGLIFGILWLVGASPDFRVIFWITFVVNGLIGLAQWAGKNTYQY